jgi:hypothetical protein
VHRRFERMPPLRDGQRRQASVGMGNGDGIAGNMAPAAADAAPINAVRRDGLSGMVLLHLRRIDVLQGRKKNDRAVTWPCGRPPPRLPGGGLQWQKPKGGALRGLVEPRKPLCAPYPKWAVNEPEGRWSRSSATTAAHADPPTCRPRPPGPGRGDCRADREPSPRIWNWHSSCALKLVPVKGRRYPNRAGADRAGLRQS